MPLARAAFTVTGWDGGPYDEPDEGPHLSRVTVRKAFTGDLEGESVGEGLFCGMNDPAAGAGYLVMDRFTGTVDGRAGGFVFQHTGLAGAEADPRAGGHVVPGSGTGGLRGLVGTVELRQEAGGAKELLLDYHFT